MIGFPLKYSVCVKDITGVTRSTFTESAREYANSIKMTFLSFYKALLRHLDFFVNSTSVMFKEDGLFKTKSEKDKILAYFEG